MPFTYQRDGRHHLAGCAEAALEGIVIDEGLLNRVESAVLGKTLDGRDIHAIGRGG